MLSQFMQGAPRSTPGTLRRRPAFSRFTCWLTSLAAALLLCALVHPGATLLAQDTATPPAQTTPPSQSSSSSSAAQSSSSAQPSEQERLESQRGLETRRAQTRQRRQAQIVTDTYTHRWEIYTGGTYMRFRPGPALHNAGTGGWTLGFTRYFTPRFGITADARGYYAATSGINNPYDIYNANFSVFPFTIGPQYRFYGSPKFSISIAAQAGIIYGYFDADTNGIAPQLVGLYPASVKEAAITSLNLDYNLSPGLAVRLAPHILFDNFGGVFNHNQGLLFGLVYRWGRQ